MISLQDDLKDQILELNRFVVKTCQSRREKTYSIEKKKVRNGIKFQESYSGISFFHFEQKRIVAKALDGQRYPLPLCECMWV